MKCQSCGASLTPKELERQACAYCGTAAPHAARSAQQAPAVSELLADRNRDGIPDILEGMIDAAGGTGPTENQVSVSSHTAVMINGRLVTGPDSLPPEARRLLESLGGMDGPTGADAAADPRRGSKAGAVPSFSGSSAIRETPVVTSRIDMAGWAGAVAVAAVLMLGALLFALR